MYSIGISTGFLAPPDGIAHASRSSAHAFRPSQVSSDLRSRRTHSSASRSTAKRSTLIVPVDRSRIRPRNGRRFISGSQSDGCTVRQRWDPIASSGDVMVNVPSLHESRATVALLGASASSSRSDCLSISAKRGGQPFPSAAPRHCNMWRLAARSDAVIAASPRGAIRRRGQPG